MKVSHSLSRWNVCSCLVALALLAPAFSGAAAEEKSAAEKPSITLLKVPTVGPGPTETGEIKGKVTGVSPSECKVVIYAKGGDVYYVQPTEETPYTGISKDGSFSDEIHGGDEFVALLVKKSYKPKAKIAKVPEEGGEILAIDRMRREKKS